MAKISIKQGVIVPDKQAVTSLLLQIGKKIATDKKLARRLKTKPGEILSAMGLNEDIRLELLKASNVAKVSIGCALTCWHTCWFTTINCDCTIVTVQSFKKFE